MNRIAHLLPNPFAYDGRGFDPKDLQFNQHRHFDPTVGRWVSDEPVGFEAGGAKYKGDAN
jgi:RHS repeat-associated protein